MWSTPLRPVWSVAARLTTVWPPVHQPVAAHAGAIDVVGACESTFTPDTVVVPALPAVSLTLPVTLCGAPSFRTRSASQEATPDPGEPSASAGSAQSKCT